MWTAKESKRFTNPLNAQKAFHQNQSGGLVGVRLHTPSQKNYNTLPIKNIRPSEIFSLKQELEAKTYIIQARPGRTFKKTYWSGPNFKKNIGQTALKNWPAEL